MAASANNVFSVSGAYAQSARVLCDHIDTKQTGTPTTTQPCRPSSVACMKPLAARRSSEGPTRAAQHTAQMVSAWLQLWLWDTARMKDGHPLQTLGRPLFEPKSGPDTHQSPWRRNRNCCCRWIRGGNRTWPTDNPCYRVRSRWTGCVSTCTTLHCNCWECNRRATTHAAAAEADLSVTGHGKRDSLAEESGLGVKRIHLDAHLVVPFILQFRELCLRCPARRSSVDVPTQGCHTKSPR